MDLIGEFRYRWRSLRYGNEIVQPATAKRVFLEVASSDLIARGFQAVDDRFVRTIDGDISHLVSLEQLRGTFCLKWGVSLAFVPHSWRSQIRWHRTPKSARFDLFEAPAVASELPPREFDRIVADGTHGPAFFRKDLRRLWKTNRREILDWLDEVVTVEAVVEKARQQRQAGRNWHSPSPVLVEAFSLARLGQADAGERLLDELIEADSEILEPVEHLRGAFVAIASVDETV